MMIAAHRASSPVLRWPDLLTRELPRAIEDGTPVRPEYERLLFRPFRAPRSTEIFVETSEARYARDPLHPGGV